MTEEEKTRRAEAQRQLAIEIAAKQLGVTADALTSAVEYVEDVAADPWTDEVYEALR